jgi:hypothetical protein
MRQVAVPLIALALLAASLNVVGGCTDKGDGLFGTGPDDRVDRGGGPDTVAVFAAADTYSERTVDDDGTHLIVGSIASQGLEAVSFLRFENLPSSDGELAEVTLVLFSDSELIESDDYDIRISCLEDSIPASIPYWPGPPDGADFIDVQNLTTQEDTTSTGLTVRFVEIGLPASWIEGWIDDPSSNYGLRLSGGQLGLSSSGEVLPRFRRAGQFSEGSYNLSPRLDAKKTDQTDPEKWSATENIFIHAPTLGPVGDLGSMRIGGLFNYRLLLSFAISDSINAALSDSLSGDGGGTAAGPDSFSTASVNKALLTLNVDLLQPEVNQGIIDVVARPVIGHWSEELTNVNVELDPAGTPTVVIDADEEDKIVLDVTALVEMFTTDGVFEVAVVRSGVTPSVSGIALLTTENADIAAAPFLNVIYTTPPGGRYSE